MIEREPGFYWIRDLFGNWVPALWESGRWWQVSCKMEEKNIREIGERIERKES